MRNLCMILLSLTLSLSTCYAQEVDNKIEEPSYSFVIETYPNGEYKVTKEENSNIIIVYQLCDTKTGKCDEATTEKKF